MDLKTPWKKTTLVSMDLETTGKYPLQADICEMAAVSWSEGEIQEEYQTLIKPVDDMRPEVIAIHNITEEMVATAPPIAEKVSEFHQFISQGVCVAHHAPFDMGFLSYEFEKAKLPLPKLPGLCTSLLSRALITDTKNHRLSTLAEHFQIEVGQAHRALDDSKTCLQVLLKILETHLPDATLEEVYEAQLEALPWSSFSVDKVRVTSDWANLVEAIEQNRALQMTYLGGSRPGQEREVFPVGLVLRPSDAFVVAKEPGRLQPKRYMLQKIQSCHF